MGQSQNSLSRTTSNDSTTSIKTDTSLLSEESIETIQSKDSQVSTDSIETIQSDASNLSTQSRISNEKQRVSEIRERVIKRKDNQGRENTTIKYLVLSGGGVKGLEYSGVADALERSGNFSGLEGISGSSAGAISAALMASGISASKFKTIVNSTNMKKLLGKGGFLMFGKDGEPLYKLISTSVKESISEYLKADIKDILTERLAELNEFLEKTEEKLFNADEEKDAIDNEVAKLKDLTDQTPSLEEEKELSKMITTLKLEKEKLEDLEYTRLELIQNISKLKAIKNGNTLAIDELRHRANSDNGKIFFKDLALMHLIDPYKFKDLYITAVEKDTGELKVFSTIDTPDIEIAAACRASASLPIILKPAKLGEKKYIDGGYKDNTPYDHFKKHTKLENVEDITDDMKKIQEAKGEGRTLALAFNNGTEFRALYSAEKNITRPSKLQRFLYDVVLKVAAKIGGRDRYTELDENTHQNMREHALETIALDTKGIGTTDFKKSQKKAEHLYYAGYLQTAEYIAQHELYDASYQAPYLKHQIFCMSVYDELDKTKFRNVISHKISLDEKNSWLLSFCAPETWKKPDNIKEYIMMAAINRTNEKFSSNTTSIEAILKVLNRKTTSDDIKKSFAEAIGKKNSSAEKFAKKDIESFLKEQNINASDLIKKYRHQTTSASKGSFTEKELERRNSSSLTKGRT